MRVLVAAGLLVFSLASSQVQAGEITRQQRIAAQHAIESVLWKHRIWPAENPGPKPPVESLIDNKLVETTVDDLLRRSAALEMLYSIRLDGDAIQRELDRIARATRNPKLLRELFAALGDDPALIGETLARPALVERRLRVQLDEPFDRWWASQRQRFPAVIPAASQAQSLPEIEEASACNPGTWRMLPGYELPEPRLRHTAVWTGTEMLIWGGEHHEGRALGVGSAYDPVTDTWRAISILNAPAARARHTAVWTGTRMIVWGGAQLPNNQPLGDGGSYDPTSDTWTPIPATQQPARHGHTAVWTGSKMIVWGGYRLPGASTPTNTGSIYEPSTGSWSSTPLNAAPSARGEHTAVWTGTRMVIWGGDGGAITALKTGAMFDPTLGTWTPMPSAGAVSARREHAAVWAGNRMMIFGGNFLDGTQTVELLDGAWFDPSDSGSWSPLTTFGMLDPGSSQATLVYTGSDVILFGGRIASNAYTNSGNRYSIATDSWSPIANAARPSLRFRHTAVWTGSEMIIWGGTLSRGDISGGRYNPATNRWTPTASGLPEFTRRSEAGTVWTGAEWIIWGGESAALLDTGVRYTPALDAWTSLDVTYAPDARYAHSAVWSGDRMLAWGGRAGFPFGPPIYLGSGGMFVPTGIGAWYSIADSDAPSPRYDHAASWTGTRMLVWGGTSAGGELGDGGAFDPGPIGDVGSWSTLPTSGAPVARSGPTGTWTGSRWIVWGGRTASGVTDTGGIYDPSAMTWQPTAVSNPPEPRYGHSAVWTGSHMLIWGGTTGEADLNSGSSYDPSGSGTWTPLTQLGAPDSRAFHAAVWTGHSMLIWGGANAFIRHNDGAQYSESTGWEALPVEPRLLPRTLLEGVWTGNTMLVGTGMPVTNSSAEYCVCRLPGEPGGLRFVDLDTLTWNGAIEAIRFDLLRSATPSDFVSSIDCVAHDTASSTIDDPVVPSAGALFAYLVRGLNDCGTGIGSLGQASDGTPRAGAACP